MSNTRSTAEPDRSVPSAVEAQQSIDLGLASADLDRNLGLSHSLRVSAAHSGVRVREAKAGGGTAIERFAAALDAIVRELAAHPAVCVNLTVAMGRVEAMAEVVMAGDQAVMAPLRELLIEARAVGDADVPDVDLTAAMVLGGITMAVIQRYSTTGEIDADALSESVAVQVMNGVRIR